jgi:hypothetical protein
MERLPGTTIYRNIDQYPAAERYEGIVMVHSMLPSANTQNFREKLQKYQNSTWKVRLLPSFKNIFVN